VSIVLLRFWITITAPFGADERGQTTTEYALVMLAAAAVAGLLLAWATKSHGVSKLFDAVIEKVQP
jgi:Flp pilus assembly pilin Flp